MRQRDLILAHLKRGRTLTPMSALNMFGVFRLAARVLELKEAGHPIKTQIVRTSTDKRIAVYRLKS